MKITVEIEYQDGQARDISVDDIRRALVAFVPHKIVSVQAAAKDAELSRLREQVRAAGKVVEARNMVEAVNATAELAAALAQTWEAK